MSIIAEVLTSPKTVLATGGGTVAIAKTKEYFAWIPPDIADFGVLIGIVVSSVTVVGYMIKLVLHVRQDKLAEKKGKIEIEAGKLENEKTRIELELLKKQLEDKD
jgi:hypothetical protein